MNMHFVGTRTCSSTIYFDGDYSNKCVVNTTGAAVTIRVSVKEHTAHTPVALVCPLLTVRGFELLGRLYSYS